MNYDENIFKEKANRKARKIWLIFALLLSANYGSDVANGLQKADYYIIFLILCWLPIILGEILLRVKGFTTDIYKYDLVIGYGIFYTFVVSTTASPIAFTLYPAGNEPAGSRQKQAFHDKLRHCEFHHYYRQCCISLHAKLGLIRQ